MKKLKTKLNLLNDLIFIDILLKRQINTLFSSSETYKDNVGFKLSIKPDKRILNDIDSTTIRFHMREQPHSIIIKYDIKGFKNKNCSNIMTRIDNITARGRSYIISKLKFKNIECITNILNNITNIINIDKYEEDCKQYIANISLFGLDSAIEYLELSISRKDDVCLNTAIDNCIFSTDGE